jgi:dephospho-CoA kinase
MLIGITGTLGAGKTTVASYLLEKGFVYRSVRSFITDEVTRRNLPISRDSLVAVGNEIRLEHGPDYIIRTLVVEAVASGADVVIESIRAIAEADLLLQHGGYLVSIDADQALRYERVMASHSQIVPVSLTEFQAQEAREMHSPDSTKQSIADVMSRAQFTIKNTGSETELQQAVDTIVETIRMRYLHYYDNRNYRDRRGR